MSILKEKYLEALRSGDYNQIRTQLGGTDDDGNCGHCALGVLCVVAGYGISEGGIEILDPNTEDGYADGYQPLYKIISTADVTNIWMMNDSEKKSFAEIADYVEEEVEFF
jgi:hypothetical protein